MWWLLLFALPSLAAGQKVLEQDDERDAFSYYITRPDIEAPKWAIETYDAKALQQDHYWFVAPYQKLEQDSYPMWNGPFIYRTDGELVWSGSSLFDYNNIQDFHMTQVNGTNMLSFLWVKYTTKAGRIWDNTYSPHRIIDITTVLDRANMHDLNIFDDGKRVLALTHLGNHRKELPEAGGKNCSVHWEGFIEMDLATNERLFEWEAFGKITLDETAARRIKSPSQICENIHGWDAYHFNAIDKFPDGDYLLSAKNTDTVYKVSHKDGSIVWRLGGYKSDFELKPGSRFSRQHHARVRSQNETHTVISVFNNARRNGFMTSEVQTDRSSALLLLLRTDVQPMTAEVLTRYPKPYWHWHRDQFHDSWNVTKTRGSFTFLPNGNAFVGWVNDCQISEHAPDGTLLQQAILLKHTANTYRSYKMPWVGYPAQPPDAVSEVIGTLGSKKLSTVVHVSWNGATEVASWNVLNVTRWGSAGDVVTSQQKNGFETMISLHGYVDRVIVVGLNAAGEELGRTRVIATHARDGLIPQGYSFFTIALFSAAVVAGVIFGVRFVRRYRGLKIFSRTKRVSYRAVDDAEEDGFLSTDDEGEEDEQRFSHEEKKGFRDDIAQSRKLSPSGPG